MFLVQKAKTHEFRKKNVDPFVTEKHPATSFPVWLIPKKRGFILSQPCVSTRSQCLETEKLNPIPWEKTIVFFCGQQNKRNPSSTFSNLYGNYGSKRCRTIHHGFSNEDHGGTVNPRFFDLFCHKNFPEISAFRSPNFPQHFFSIMRTILLKNFPHPISIQFSFLQFPKKCSHFYVIMFPMGH